MMVMSVYPPRRRVRVVPDEEKWLIAPHNENEWRLFIGALEVNDRSIF